MSDGQRSYYLDYLRAFFVLMVVFDHVIHPYTYHFDRYWFITDVDSSLVFDGLHLICYAVMVPGLFFLSGVFTPHSFKRRGLWGYICERMVRLGIPFGFGLVFIGAVIIYLQQVHSGKYTGTLIAFFTTRYFPDSMAATGFWYLSFLFVLTLVYVFIQLLWPGFSQWLGRCVAYGELYPGVGYCVLGCLLSTSIVGLEVPFGPWIWWSVFSPYLLAMGSLMGTYGILFCLGIGVYQHFGIGEPRLFGFLDNHRVFILVSTAFVVSVYLLIALGYVNDGAFDMSLPLASYHHKIPTHALYAMMGDVPVVNWVRAALLGFVMLGLLLTGVWVFGRYLDKPVVPWQTLAHTSYGIYIFHEALVLGGHIVFYGGGVPLILRVFLIFGVSVCVPLVLVKHGLRRVPGLSRVL
ncbi:MAG: acyltransferase family protein [Alphaproteobacteria bacterium]|nr:MAG: acyltransferase family protein [Alphaproteobacteria bacterium]